MSKLTDGLSAVGGGAFAIIIWVIGACVSLVFSYFAIIFTLAIGNSIFNKEEPSAPPSNLIGEQTKATIKEGFMETCAVDPVNTAYCQCTADALTNGMTRERYAAMEAAVNSNDEQKKTEFLTPYTLGC